MLYALHSHLHRQSCEEFCRIRGHEASPRESSSRCRGGGVWGSEGPGPPLLRGFEPGTRSEML